MSMSCVCFRLTFRRLLRCIFSCVTWFLSLCHIDEKSVVIKLNSITWTWTPLLCLRIYSTLKPTCRTKRHKSQEIKHTATVHRLHVTEKKRKKKCMITTAGATQHTVCTFYGTPRRHRQQANKRAHRLCVSVTKCIYIMAGFGFFFFPLTLCTQEVNTVAHSVCAACTKCSKSSNPTLSAAMSSNITLFKIHTDDTVSPGLLQCIWYWWF